MQGKCVENREDCQNKYKGYYKRRVQIETTDTRRSC